MITLFSGFFDSDLKTFCKGQLCLYTNKEETSQENEPQLQQEVSKTLFNKKPPVKSWMDDITDNFCLSASHILKERVYICCKNCFFKIKIISKTFFLKFDTEIPEPKQITTVVGKHSNYFINTLRAKSR